MFWCVCLCVCVRVCPCRLYSEAPEAAESWILSEQQLVSNLMLFCQKCFGCWCLSNLSLQKFHLQDKRPNTTCCLAQRLENVANSAWLLSLAAAVFFFLLQDNHQDKFCLFFSPLALRVESIKSSRNYISLTLILSGTVDPSHIIHANRRKGWHIDMKRLRRIHKYC